jgi:hypothetical protein
MIGYNQDRFAQRREIFFAFDAFGSEKYLKCNFGNDFQDFVEHNFKWIRAVCLILTNES